jgi:hypothetical protein
LIAHRVGGYSGAAAPCGIDRSTASPSLAAHAAPSYTQWISFSNKSSTA